MTGRTPEGDAGDEPAKGWRKSSYSQMNGHCIEAAPLANGRIGVRDSKIAGPILHFEPTAWTAFLREIRLMNAHFPELT